MFSKSILPTLLLHFYLCLAKETCYKAKNPHNSTCIIPDLWQLREDLCNYDGDWTEPSKRGLVGLSVQTSDRCLADNSTFYTSFRLTITSTVLDRDDCLNRTSDIIEHCVQNVAPGTSSGGNWDDPDGPGKTQINVYFQREYPREPVNPCYIGNHPECSGVAKPPRARDGGGDAE
ncbi:hypothetical protein EJ04DRAFT_566806 [Polyplosphaeria fusca]|uniref:Uncharacterized protein n=1 Tax=Polyplosphaeria fusca TaxID=682080 RepID=A0A9P4UZW2_9PLEO|nr:hypothetical protein EJ04DRAFT_566806 [Polyplosphaeria fusca]